ncbi:Beta-carotene hydroxylase [Auxenochlorella protothecoides]|nr:Beta-carotene hydroxylase [Auxenochlorella protothecoides]KFM24946.1 Beta-carotene hydroxylase [Auxenochlorella protothecoides]RMZ52635.1 hypothetical protein APUTEX25_000754 [Auxenochlorella protothecoides]|eukprot:RMZ52635.1 hypothetical protein APUTEX25_000754 [Auxenochlorella protothecoides]
MNITMSKAGGAQPRPGMARASANGTQAPPSAAPTPQPPADRRSPAAERRSARAAKRARHAAVYQASALAATFGIVALAVGATALRITRHLDAGDPLPLGELAGTLVLMAGSAVAMEMYARWAHRVLWHDAAWGWALHASHHAPREGAFEANDLFALANALPAMGLCLYGFLRPDALGGALFGAGLGVTLFGISYMFVHDGLVHRRFPVGPIADVPVLRRIAAAHKLHHSDKYGGVPFGMFLGPQELEAVGAGLDLEALLAAQSAKRGAKDADPLADP